jgi:hypothetical protein
VASETGGRNGASVAKFRTRRPSHIREMRRCRAVLSVIHMSERLIGTLRRECLDHVLIIGEWHLRQMLASYSSYYNESRTHLALEKDAPLRRAIQRYGAIITTPILSGLHHRYVRI